MALKEVVKEVQTQLALAGVEVSQKSAREVLDIVLTIVKNTSVEEGKLTVPNFGTFKVKQRAERNGRNPQTGEALTIPAKQVLTFKASK
jgi:nucleoid DNA-binding protein